MKINFFVVGAQKAGTSAIDYYLRQHPEIVVPQKKELHFFNNEDIFSKNAINYSLLEEQFVWKEGINVYGEVTPIYMYWPPSIKRIWEYNKNAKVIAILRNPIARAFSQWNMQISNGLEKNSFSYCIKNEAERIRDVLSEQNIHFSYIQRGFYSRQIKNLWEIFPKEQVLLIKYEDFLSHQKESIGHIFNFLGVDPKTFHFKHKEVHKTTYSCSLKDEERSYLLDLFSQEIVETEKMLDWDCSDWKQ